MTEFSGIERRLSELNERLTRLRPLQEKSRTAFDEDPYLRDVVERNLEIEQFARHVRQWLRERDAPEA